MTTAPLLTVDCWLVDVRGLGAAATTKWDSAEPVQRERAAVLAVSALQALAGGAVEACLHVVRPTAGPTGPRTWEVYPLTGGGSLSPQLRSGTWINSVCSCGASTGHACNTVRLPGAREVAQVVVGGVVLDESAWRLESGGVLRRLDGGTWPRLQPLEPGPEGEHSFVVSYYTSRPGRAGEYAAGRLALEFLGAITGGACALPSSVTQVARNGVTVTMTPGIFPEGLTGVLEVDSWVKAVNPYTLVEPSVVLTPDMPKLNAAAPVPWTPPAPGDFDGGSP